MQWYHFCCVGVTSQIAFDEWICDNCKYNLPKNPDEVDESKENRPPERQRRKTRSVRSTSTVSTTRSQIFALRKLDEERALKEKRDQEECALKEKRDEEYLLKKYSILEGTIDEPDEQKLDDQEFEKSSYENTVLWAREMQNLSKEFENKLTVDNISLSMTEDERTVLGQRFFY